MAKNDSREPTSGSAGSGSDGASARPLKLEDELLDGQTWTTMGALGAMMPLAIGDRSFVLRPNTLENARRRGAKTPESAKALPADLAVWGLAASLATLQGEPVGDDLASAVAKLQCLPWPSVLYMLFWTLRASRRGGRYTHPEAVCPHPGCGAVQDLSLDVGSMRVRDWGARSALPQLDADLEDGFVFPPEQRVRSVVLQPAPWGAMMGLSPGELSVPAEMTASFLSRAIIGVDTIPGMTMVPASVLGQLTDADSTFLDEAHVLLSGGPVPALSAPCRRCQKDIYVAIQWASADFFGASSDDRRQRRRLRSR